MNSAATIVVIIFVISIITSLGNKGYTPPQTVPTTPEAVKFVSSAVDPTYFGTAGQNARSAIEKYILQYRPQEEAGAIAGSIMAYSQSSNVNPKLVAALIARESRFNPRAVSSSGAVGLGQLLPSTCQTTGVINPYDINDNVKGTVRYLKYLLDRFRASGSQVPFAIAGYLEGPNAVERNKGYNSHSAAYVSDILEIYNKI